MTYLRIRCPVAVMSELGHASLCGRPAVGYLDPEMLGLPRVTPSDAYPACAYHLNLWSDRAVSLDRIPHGKPWGVTA